VALAAGGVTAAVRSALLRGPVPGGQERWARTNHAGSRVTLLEGVALVGGTAVAGAVCGPLAGAGVASSAAVTVTALGAGGVGAVDDLREDTDRKGLAGHLGALARGRVTTGALKILVLAGTGLVAAAMVDRRVDRGVGTPAESGPPWWATLVGGAVVAGSANLANLLDLRPGRALKAGLLTVAPLLLTGPGSPAAAVVAGAGTVLLPDDLAGRSMLGDTGANPWGALVGLALVERCGGRSRVLVLTVVTALTLVSERVSFTAVIESTPVLREIDALGRPPR
jgi:UDP-N-acetylmuramyl pentapeptide phosphotransferase/UDP-N-acetylglucosamine-1-phosphate transferase